MEIRAIRKLLHQKTEERYDTYVNKVIETYITINAPVSKVWDVFVRPELTRKMGGEYVSDWQVGSPFGFKMGGDMVTHGMILALEPQQLLQHSLFGVDAATAISTVTYSLHADGDRTVLSGREELVDPLDDTDYADAVEGWKAALAAVKDTAES
jgi:uncharacterized protein YndB with AHSA1/START domain